MVKAIPTVLAHLLKKVKVIPKTIIALQKVLEVRIPMVVRPLVIIKGARTTIPMVLEIAENIQKVKYINSIQNNYNF